MPNITKASVKALPMINSEHDFSSSSDEESIASSDMSFEEIDKDADKDDASPVEILTNTITNINSNQTHESISPAEVFETIPLNQCSNKTTNNLDKIECVETLLTSWDLQDLIPKFQSNYIRNYLFHNSKL